MAFYLALCLILTLCACVNSQRYMPYSDPYYTAFQPNPMPQFRQVASYYQQYTGRKPDIMGDGVRVGDNTNGLWLLCQSANCGRG
jgi:hypothetical protein